MQYATNLVSSSPSLPDYSSRAAKKDAACQTLSTGDIVITKIFFKEDQDKQEKVFLSRHLKVKSFEKSLEIFAR